MKQSIAYELGGLVVVVAMVVIDSGIWVALALFGGGLIVVGIAAWWTNWGEGYDKSKGS